MAPLQPLLPPLGTLTSPAVRTVRPSQSSEARQHGDHDLGQNQSWSLHGLTHPGTPVLLILTLFLCPYFFVSLITVRLGVVLLLLILMGVLSWTRCLFPITECDVLFPQINVLSSFFSLLLELLVYECYYI